jgi:hypothetical protein
MPYIKQEERDRFAAELRELLEVFPNEPGNINYLISSICNSYLTEVGVNYTNINSLIGVLECTKLELYRRIAAPYEDRKIKENGDVSISCLNPRCGCS